MRDTPTPCRLLVDGAGAGGQRTGAIRRVRLMICWRVPVQVVHLPLQAIDVGHSMLERTSDGAGEAQAAVLRQRLAWSPAGDFVATSDVNAAGFLSLPQRTHRQDARACAAIWAQHWCSPDVSVLVHPGSTAWCKSRTCLGVAKRDHRHLPRTAQEAGQLRPAGP